MPAAPGRVLLLVPQPFFQWRGSPIRVGFSALALGQLGYEVDLLVMPFGEDRDIPGVTLHRARNILGARNLSIGPSLAKAVLDVPLFLKARALAGRHPYAVVHGVEEAGALAPWVARRCGAKVVYEKHSDPGSYKQGRIKSLVMAAYARVERYAVAKADAVICTGPGLAEQARAMGPGKPVHHIFDIPSSLAEPSPQASADWRRRWTAPGQDVLALYVGSFAAYQGIDLLFGAIPPACAATPNLRFVIVGGTEAEIAERREALRARGVEDRVVFAGKIPPDELPSALAAADILLSPRLDGTNTPLKILDYLKAGRAIAATDRPANRLILNHDNAMLAPPTPEGFGEAVAALARDPTRRDVLAAKGRRIIDEEMNFEEFKRRLGRCYDQILGTATP